MKVAKIKGIEEAKIEIMRQTKAEMSEILTMFADECMDYVWALWPAKTGRSIENLFVNPADIGCNHGQADRHGFQRCIRTSCRFRNHHEDIQ